MRLGEVQYNTGIPKYIYPTSLGEVQYNTGIPKYIYPTSLGGSNLGNLFQRDVSSVTSKTTNKGSSLSVKTGPSAFEQIGSFVGDIGALGATFLNSYNEKSITKKRLKYEQQLNIHRANLEHLSEKDRIAAELEIQRIQAELSRFSQETSSVFGISMAKVLSLAAISGIGLMGLFIIASRS